MPDRIFTEPIRLLIVDDDENAEDLIVKSIRRDRAISVDKWTISTIASIDELRELIHADKLTYDCILLDVKLGPQCEDSVSALRQCRRFWRAAPVIIVTNFVDDDYVTNAMAAGAAGYIRKAQMGGLGLAIVSALRHFAQTTRLESLRIEAALAQFKKSVDGLMHDARELTRSMSQLLVEHGNETNAANVGSRKALVEAKLAQINHWLTSYLDSFRAVAKPHKTELCDIYRLTEDCADVVRQRYRDVSVNVGRPEPEPSVICDSTKIARALINILDNAAKLSPKTHLRVDVSIVKYREDDVNFCRICIRDYGPGVMDTEDILFGEYRRGDWQGSLPGFGIGLSTSKSLLEQHVVGDKRGEIRWRNHAPSELGATFMIDFPISAAPTDSAP